MKTFWLSSKVVNEGSFLSVRPPSEFGNSRTSRSPSISSVKEEAPNWIEENENDSIIFVPIDAAS